MNGRSFLHCMMHCMMRCMIGCMAALPGAVGLAAAAAPVVAGDPESAESRGLAIARDARERKQGFESFTASQTMLLRNRQGRESRRHLRVKVLETDGDGDRSLFVFDEPRDVRGTAFLVHARKDGPDDQWLYLPGLKRVKRINSANRSGSFMGSEFAYEDMTPPEVEQFSYRYLRDEACEDLTCTVVERMPLDARSGYLRQLVWQDTDALRLWKVEYYNKRDELQKTLVVRGYERYVNRYWHAAEMTMVNHLTGKSTVLSWSNYEFGAAVTPGEFLPTGLRRAR